MTLSFVLICFIHTALNQASSRGLSCNPLKGIISPGIARPLHVERLSALSADAYGAPSVSVLHAAARRLRSSDRDGQLTTS